MNRVLQQRMNQISRQHNLMFSTANRHPDETLSGRLAPKPKSSSGDRKTSSKLGR